MQPQWYFSLQECKRCSWASRLIFCLYIYNPKTRLLERGRGQGSLHAPRKLSAAPANLLRFFSSRLFKSDRVKRPEWQGQVTSSPVYTLQYICERVKTVEIYALLAMKTGRIVRVIVEQFFYVSAQDLLGFPFRYGFHWFFYVLPDS